MASIQPSSCLLLLSSFLVILTAIAASPIQYSLKLGDQGAVGGRTDVKDAAADEEVQSLGRFAVEEYNRQGSSSRNAPRLLLFSQVVAAQRQVVAGIKYFLKVAARDSGDTGKTFDAVVVVKPWVESKELLSFDPSSTSS